MIPPTATMSHIHHLFASMISHREKLCYMTSNTNIKLYSERMTCITQNLIFLSLYNCMLVLEVVWHNFSIWLVIDASKWWIWLIVAVGGIIVALLCLLCYAKVKKHIAEGNWYSYHRFFGYIIDDKATQNFQIIFCIFVN